LSITGRASILEALSVAGI